LSQNISPNTTLAHYIIISNIGAGVMGEVYLAQDTKLDRKVALKILPADLSESGSDAAVCAGSKSRSRAQPSQHRAQL